MHRILQRRFQDLLKSLCFLGGVRISSGSIVKSASARGISQEFTSPFLWVSQSQGTNMVAKDLRVGDRVRIVGIPGVGVPNYVLMPETKRVYKKLILRGAPVRIYEIDEFGGPWCACRFKTKDGKWEHHHLAVFDDDNNWVPVIARRARKRNPES
jgi:hypothetical protein